MNAKYPDRCTSFLLAKIYNSTGIRTTQNLRDQSVGKKAQKQPPFKVHIF
jgi:hypothetical protein